MAIRLTETELSEERQANLDRYHKDAVWFGAHVEELFEKYADHWVGVHQEQVVGTSTDLDELLIDLKAKGYPLNIMFFDFLDSEPKTWVLCLTKC